MSSDLLWAVVRDNSCFRYKRNGVELSSEPGNVYNVHSMKYSGLVGSKMLSVDMDDDNNAVLVHGTEDVDASRKPGSYFTTSAAESKEQIINSTHEVGYRRDLARLAVARYNKLRKSVERATALPNLDEDGDVPMTSTVMTSSN